MSNCRHFTSLKRSFCNKGIAYTDVRRDNSYPCRADFNDCGATCRGFEAITNAEEAAAEAEIQRLLDSLDAGVSRCCQAAFDESQVIQSGRHKGHGHRFCSQCKKHLFTV